MKRMIQKLKTRKNRKAQTALEYALVVGAITLVIMASWNVVGDKVKKAIEGKLSEDIQKNLIQGNATVPR
jgi:Flp pilus assembly pilin Flp